MASFAIAPLLLILLLVAGLVVLTLGIRGRPIFTSPRCAKCNYDLRAINFVSNDEPKTCPECGANLVEPGAVNYGRLQRRPRQIVAGVLLMLLAPALAMLLMIGTRRGAMVSAPIGPAASSARTTPQLITSLKSTINQPWDWQELEKRLRNGSLATQDVDAAFNVLIADLAAKRAAGQPISHLPWLDGFFNHAVQTNAVSPPVLLKLAQTYYGDAPTMRTRGRFRENQPIDFELEFDGPWDLPGMMPCWALTQVKADDGSLLAPTSYYNPKSATAGHPDQFTGTNRGGDTRGRLAHSLPTGEHELTLTFDMGAVPQNTTFHGLDGKPGTVDKWPKAIATWQSTVKYKITIVPTSQPVIDLITDPAQDPFKSTLKISVEQALTRPASQGKDNVQLVIKWKLDGATDPAICYHVDALLPSGQKISFGRIMFGRLGRGTASSYSDQVNIKALPPEVKSIDLLLTPDPKGAEEFTGLGKIWGGEHKIEQVPLERFDTPKSVP
jgi:hypothetical protein